jgi:hypothetical protein
MDALICEDLVSFSSPHDAASTRPDHSSLPGVNCGGGPQHEMSLVRVDLLPCKLKYSFCRKTNTVIICFTEIRITKYRLYEYFNGAHALRLVRYPNAKSLIRNLPNKNEHVQTKTGLVI